jgi:hypothetical protein
MNMPAFEVYPINNSGKRSGTSVYVNAQNIERAVIAGKTWMRILGRKPRQVRAEVYRPWLDPEIRMYVQRTPATLYSKLSIPTGHHHHEYGR